MKTLSCLCFLAQMLLMECCLNNYKYTFRSEWQEGELWKSNGVVFPTETLLDWTLHIKFNAPLAVDLKTWVTDGYQNTKGKTSVVLTPRQDYKNYKIEKSYGVSYFAYFKTQQGQKHYKCIEFCGVVPKTGKRLCQHHVSTSKPTKATERTSTNPSKTAGVTASVPTANTPKPTKPTDRATNPSKTASAPTTFQSFSTIEPCKSKYNYKEVLTKSLLFYEAQRSGKLPLNQRVMWRKDSTLTDGSDVGKDLSGGYFDAGDYVKFGFPMASAMTVLAWGMVEFKKGYILAGQFEYGLSALKWGTDYLLRCHTGKNEFYVQVGDGDVDHKFWGRPEDMKMKRPSFKIDASRPGSEIAAETAAALAAASIVFRRHNKNGYADLLVRHAEQLYQFADKYRGHYHVSVPQVASFYKSYSGFHDELAWAILWLYKATGKTTYRNMYLAKYSNQATTTGLMEFSWDNKWGGVKVLAAQLGVSKNNLKEVKKLLMQPKLTPKGLFFVSQWGSNRHASNLAFIALVAANVQDQDFYEKFARQQIHYMLGDSGRSYVVGFGHNPPQRPHHSSSSCPTVGPCNWNNFHDSRPNPQILYGALVGGPDQQDGYEDKRNDFVKNEVTLDYNAGFQSALAGLIQLQYTSKRC